MSVKKRRYWALPAQVALQDGPNKVTIEAALDAPGDLVLADTRRPDWRATVDGEPVKLIRANHAFRAVFLSAGQHTISMIYRPESVLVGGGISLACAVVVASIALFCALRNE